MTGIRALRALVASAIIAALALFAFQPAAYAADCGSAVGDWMGLTVASIWDTEIYLYDGPVDETAVVALTYAGQVAGTVVSLPLADARVMTGSWALDNGGMTWSATGTVDNTYRLTLSATADSCGIFGGVHSANGSVIQQDVGLVGIVYMTRVV